MGTGLGGTGRADWGSLADGGGAGLVPGFCSATGMIGSGLASGFIGTVGIVSCGMGSLGASFLTDCCGVGGLTGFGFGVSTKGFSSVSGSSTTMTSIGSSASAGCFAHSQLTPNAITTWNAAEPARL